MRTVWNWGRIGMYGSGVVSEIIVIYLFLQFAKPVQLKSADESDSDYEEEFDQIRDPNYDMMYYVKNMPKMKQADEDYDVSRSS
jgi:hypothetical protein